jgi:pimeloyl-ACP methyl ester carboxylesterase
LATFVLVPGSMCGGWLWRPLVPLLRAEGHEAHPVTLTGHGDRVHLASAEVDLDTHISDLVNLLFYEDLRDVILVGHSAAGMTITGAADRVPERVSRLVYLDAVVPRDGESLYSAHELTLPKDDHWQQPVIFAEEQTREILPDIAEEDVSWFYERMTPELVKTMTQPIRLTNPATEEIPRTYVFCVKNWTWDDQDNPLPPDILRARTGPGWDFRELDTDHVPMFARPRELADLLLSLV